MKKYKIQGVKTENGYVIPVQYIVNAQSVSEARETFENEHPEVTVRSINQVSSSGGCGCGSRRR
jgi:hypothetical protein